MAVRQNALLLVEVPMLGCQFKTHAVDVSGNERWKVNLAHIITDADFLSRYITYYNKRCHTGNCFTAP